MILRAKITVKGRVQGVGFRVSARQRALKYNLNGYAQNVGIDQVIMEVEGPSQKVNAFIRDVESGLHKFIRIDEMEVDELEKKGDSGFKIL